VTKSTTLYFLFLAGALFLFATCKQATDSATEEKTEMAADAAEIERKERDNDTRKAIPSEDSKAPASAYVFKRNTNPYNQSYFRNPFDSAIYVSGTFCELRGNHFHAGLDIRTGGRQGWKVLAAADGYVERIKISTGGYGRAIYIRHPNGFTTVYGHLQKFTGALANYVKDAQYKQRTFEIELFPKRGELQVTKGQNFARSGNTGGSGGPHLHFEIRNPKGQSTNPLLHGLKVTDNLKPEIKRISVHRKDKESLYSTGTYPYTTFSKWSDYVKNTKTLNLQPGAYSFGLFTDDYFTDRKNVLGINYCWLTANDQLLYAYQIEKFNFDQGRYIYTHTDPYLKWKEKKTYFRLFKESYNPLPYYRQRQKGEIRIQHGDSVRMKLYIQDYAGLTDSATWTVVGDTAGKQLRAALPTYEEKHRVTGNTSFSFYEWAISVPKKAVYHPFDFTLGIGKAKPNVLSKTLQMHYGYTPLHTYINVDYTVPAKWLSYGEKLCAVSFNGQRTYYEGGTLNGNKLRFKTRSLGEYAISFDDESPKITVKKFGRRFKFRVTENLSGIDQIICSIDDKWILAEYEPKTNTVWGEIPAWIKAGKYEFKLIAIDHKKNRSEYKRNMLL
jgi:murein DD-endopeptidase MepM/ murein hydrolase activator NlpD